MMGRAVALRKRAVGLAAVSLLLLLPGCYAPSQSDERHEPVSRAPSRIVSMNPCVDAILREVAAPGQIAAISHYSQDARATSVPLEWALAHPVVGDTAEDVLSARPDLVIAGPHIASETLSALKRMGVPLLSTSVPATVAESKAQIAQIAARIGQPERGRALVQRIGQAVARMRSSTSHQPSALIWQDAGLVPGSGTLADELLRNAGFRSASAEMKLAQWDMVSVEQLLLDPPDIVMTGSAGMESDGAARGDARNPVLAKAGARIMIAEFPSRLLHCAGPTIIDTADHLVAIRSRWQREHKG
ncbi:MAG: ABC transporter substrate-binding protein [Sphingomonadaceae bacterium]|jgi:iron complex transport system substrate-binding protein